MEKESKKKKKESHKTNTVRKNGDFFPEDVLYNFVRIITKESARKVYDNPSRYRIYISDYVNRFEISVFNNLIITYE